VNFRDAVNVVSPTGRQDADAVLLADIRAYLGRHEAINTIQLASFLDSDSFDPSKPVVVARSGEGIVGVGTVSPGFNLLLSHIERDEAIAALVASSVRRGIDVPGVMGPGDAALGFAEHWGRLTGGSFSPGMTHRILAATSVRVPTGVPGTWRQMTTADHPKLIDWFANFGVEVDHAPPQSVERYADAMLSRLGQHGGGLIWLDELGNPVSIACYKAPTATGIRIGPVYTPPERRRRGYAGAVTAATTQLMLDRGFTFVCLYTNAANLTSNHVYEAIGYEFVSHSMQYRFHQSNVVDDAENGCS
jgi:RimJ/RimL family protein N-acetyltransferase